MAATIAAPRLSAIGTSRHFQALESMSGFWGEQREAPNWAIAESLAISWLL
jgi:hypothetical protein